MAADRREAAKGRSLLLLHPSDEPYGADRILLLMARSMRDAGWRVAVMLSDDVPPGWLSDQLTLAGVAHERGPLAPARRRYLSPRRVAGYVAWLLRARRAVRRAAVRHRADLIHINTSSLLVGAVLGRPRGARVVWHVHEIVRHPRSLALLFRLAPMTADRVVAVSDAVRDNLGILRAGRRRVVTIHNGVPATPDTVPDPAIAALGDPVVIYVGRLNRWKGYEVYVDAVERVAPSHPEAAFVLAGDPPTGEEWRSAELARRIDAAGLSGRLRLLGFHPDSAAAFSASAIAVVPSTEPDPLPTVVLEAMRAGCAVIASAHGGAVEMVEDGRSGLLVRPGDAAALAAAMDRLLSDPALRDRIGAAARDRVATLFTVERFLERLVAVYAELRP